MNESKRIEIENRELFLIGENTLKKYEREQGKIEMAIELLKNGVSAEIIAKSSKLPIEEIKKLKEIKS